MKELILTIKQTGAGYTAGHYEAPEPESSPDQGHVLLYAMDETGRSYFVKYNIDGAVWLPVWRRRFFTEFYISVYLLDKGRLFEWYKQNPLAGNYETQAEWEKDFVSRPGAVVEMLWKGFARDIAAVWDGKGEDVDLKETEIIVIKN